MSVKDFFKVVLKVLGLLLFINGIIPFVPSIFLYLTADFGMSMFYLGSAISLSLISYFLIFNSDFFIDKLKLHKGFDSKIFNLSELNPRNILELSCILLGLYAVINSLPSVILEGFQYFKYNASSDSLIDLPMHSSNYFYIQLVYLFLGLILIGLRKQISSFFN